MITASGLAIGFAGHSLFEDGSLQINRGDRIALVGPNGAGKSTLFSLLLGRLEPDAGTISIERGITIGWLPQESAAVGGESVLELAAGINPEIQSLQKTLRRREDDTPEVHEALARYAELGGHQLEARAKSILKGLAFRENDFERPARELSGGWIMRAHLARLLVMQPDLLLLDEPTNHLDLESLLWFQDYLLTLRSAILLISHDRAFLNRLSRHILEIRGRRLYRYRGDYEEFLRQRAEREALQWAAYKNQQKEIADLQRFADRFRAKASKASQAQSKLRQIERMEKIEAPESAASTISIVFPQPPRGGQHPVTLSHIDFSYDSLPVYRGMEFSCERGDRIALVGPNGAGKSTLLKLLAGELHPASGERKYGHQIRVGYFAQNRVEMLQSGRTVYEEARDLPNPAPELLTRSVLGSFLFSGDSIHKMVDVLSGGEKSRLALAKILLDPPNLLLLDEPTTHLDMPSIEALISAFDQFHGTVVFVSHDVYFIRRVGRRVLRISAGQLEWFAGDYDYYLEKSGAAAGRAGVVAGEKLPTSERPGDYRPEEENSAAPAERQRIFKTREEKKEEARLRQERTRNRRELEAEAHRLEKEITELETRQKDLTARLEDPDAYGPGGKAMQWNRELLAIQESLEELTARWESAAANLAEP